MEQISPTRTELLTRKSQIKLAAQGAELLRGKREALVREFLSEITSFRTERDSMLRTLTEAAQSLMRSLSIDGPEAVASAGFAERRSVEVIVEEQNIWGTRVTEVESEFAVRAPKDRGYSVVGTSARVDETVERFEATLELILKVAPKQQKLARLADEIRKTSRRVNALEQRLLPSLNEQVRYIRGVLDQREREDVFRLKRIKGKR
jgi:V/A-type H+/Na+-transporting ATPase subunit D